MTSVSQRGTEVTSVPRLWNGSEVRSPRAERPGNGDISDFTSWPPDVAPKSYSRVEAVPEPDEANPKRLPAREGEIWLPISTNANMLSSFAGVRIGVRVGREHRRPGTVGRRAQGSGLSSVSRMRPLCVRLVQHCFCNFRVQAQAHQAKI